jgi:single-strand DNA-binding protein
MQDTITIVGTVGTPPRHIVSAAGLAVTTFRLASSNRWFDRAQSRWVDGQTNWYSVSAFRQLALNTAASLQKGDAVIVVGKLKIKNWENGSRTGLNVDLDADAIGPDLSWGTARYAKTVGQRAVSAGDDPARQDEEPDDPDQSFADVAEPASEREFVPDGAAVVTPF